MVGPDDVDAALDDAKLVALVDMLGRTGAEEFQIRYCDEERPVVWIAAARWPAPPGHQYGVGEWVDGPPGGIWQAAGALEPYGAVMRLAESVMDGGTCQHCGRPSAVDDLPADLLMLVTTGRGYLLVSLRP